jgi:hypothetical protein
MPHGKTKENLTSLKCFLVLTLEYIYPLLFRAGTAPVSIATGYGMDGRGSIPSRGMRFFCTPQCRDWLWGPPASYIIGSGGPFPGGKAARA